MGVWEYIPKRLPESDLTQGLALQYCVDEPDREYFDQIASQSGQRCRYCRELMSVLVASEFTHSVRIDQFKHLYVCTRCGWWFYVDTERVLYHPRPVEIFCPMGEGLAGFFDVRICESTLRELDLANVNQPLEDVKDYLTAKAEARFTIHPRLFEEVVGAAFRNMGYDVIVTSYGNDGGLDAILTDSAGVVGVQVKRVRQKIKVAQIRELLGALVLSGHTRGVFVTTSDFQKGAYSLRSNAHRAGYDLHLVNGDRFLDALGVNRRSPFKSIAQFDVEFYNRLCPVRIGDFVTPITAIG